MTRRWYVGAESRASFCPGAKAEGLPQRPSPARLSLSGSFGERDSLHERGRDAHYELAVKAPQALDASSAGRKL